MPKRPPKLPAEPKQKHRRSINSRTKIVGVTVDDRQRHCRKCRSGQQLILVREKRNKVDANAIAIYRKGWLFKHQLGYVSADIADDLAPMIDAGVVVTATVLERTGGKRGENYGVNIHLQSVS